MPDIEHNTLSGSELHEPKGIDTASTGQVYKANGAGSGAWATALTFDSVVVVKSASDLSGILDSTKMYLVDGVIDMGSQSIEIPAGGLNLFGFSFDVSGLTSSATSFDLFTSPVGGSGNLVMRDLKFEVTGASSGVFDLISATGNEAIEMGMVNFNNCSSLGTINNYRQGLEEASGRFGGTPTLTLAGAWSGGWFIDTSIVRGLDVSMTEPLYKAGAGFTMASRFRSNQNIDLPTSASVLDFSPANFTSDTVLQLQNCLVSRNGVFDSSDPNLTPNVSQTDTVSLWHDNVGLSNTNPGGVNTVTAEALTTIGATSTYVDLAGTWTPSDLEHFDEPSNGQLRHLSADPRGYKVTIQLHLESAANDELSIRLLKNGSTNVKTESRVVNSLSGGRNVAIVVMFAYVELGANDYISLQVANNTTTTDITTELDSSFIIETR